MPSVENIVCTLLDNWQMLFLPILYIRLFEVLVCHFLDWGCDWLEEDQQTLQT